MSIDLQIWAATPVNSNCFGDRSKWESRQLGWSRISQNWQILVSRSYRVEPEDVPEDINRLLPGIRWMTNLNLEGKTSSDGLRLLHSTASDLARSTRGAVFNPQEDSVRLPSGVKRLMSPRSKESFDVISMSWWFLESPIASRSGREAFLELLERDLPECLPKRYGRFEPPQHVYEQTGKEHLLKFLDDNLNDIVVWYPHRPVVGVYLALPSPPGKHKQGFRTNHLSIQVEKQVLDEPGWSQALVRFWQETSTLINPIYGDVRVLGRFRWMGATVSPGERHPVTSWWWAGIPQKLGLAAVLGNVYQDLWPNFVRSATTANGLAFASLEDWKSESDLTERVGQAPSNQLLQHDGFARAMTAADYVKAQNKRREYPPGWPFGETFAN